MLHGSRDTGIAGMARAYLEGHRDSRDGGGACRDVWVIGAYLQVCQRSGSAAFVAAPALGNPATRVMAQQDAKKLEGRLGR